MGLAAKLAAAEQQSSGEIALSFSCVLHYKILHKVKMENTISTTYQIDAMAPSDQILSAAKHSQAWGEFCRQMTAADRFGDLIDAFLAPSMANLLNR